MLMALESSTRRFHLRSVGKTFKRESSIMGESVFYRREGKEMSVTGAEAMHNNMDCQLFCFHPLLAKGSISIGVAKCIPWKVLKDFFA